MSPDTVFLTLVLYFCSADVCAHTVGVGLCRRGGIVSCLTRHATCLWVRASVWK